MPVAMTAAFSEPPPLTIVPSTYSLPCRVPPFLSYVQGQDVRCRHDETLGRTDAGKQLQRAEAEEHRAKAHAQYGDAVRDEPAVRDPVELVEASLARAGRA